MLPNTARQIEIVTLRQCPNQAMVMRGTNRISETALIHNKHRSGHKAAAADQKSGDLDLGSVVLCSCVL